MSDLKSCPQCGARLDVAAGEGDGLHSTPYCCPAQRAYRQTWGTYIWRSDDTERAFKDGWNALAARVRT
jgi:hypothetical protein